LLRNSRLVLDDRPMNTTGLQPRPPETRHAESFEVGAQPRSSLLVLAGVSLAIVGAVIAVAAGMSHLVLMTLGLALFVAGSATAMRFAGPATRRASGSAWLRDVRSSTHLGPDPEQVIGRQTGARI
jgi:hypothetical protein